jgi:polyribonucleotide nucleotidyltransferase
VNGEFIINPTYQQIEESAMNLRVAGTREAILMVECGADQVEESVMIEALQTAHKAMQPLIDIQEQMREQAGKPKREFDVTALPENLIDDVRSWLGDKLEALYVRGRTKAEHGDAMEAVQLEMLEALMSDDGDHDERSLRNAFQEIYKEDVRQHILEKDLRPDGRAPGEIRALGIEVDLSPRAHGSGLFSRGETQILTLATLGTPRERQELDTLQPEEEKRYMHHYNFPPFSVGETRPLRGASRRDIGHGALAERALLPVIPELDEFPYTMRLVSEALSSNGSTSMASVCGSTLALLDTGVPISAPVAGIAMGLIMGQDRYVVLTDIQGAEDHYGDMDFKVAGTREGITALQMDIKIKGISTDLMAEALQQAREARLFILDAIQEVIPEPRPELKSHAPRMTVLKIDPQKIGAVIGPGGKIVRGIQEDTGVRIDIQDDGTIYIAATDGPSATKAREMIEALTEEAVVGRIYTGRVVRTTDFGAFVEILPNTDGLVHISQLDTERVEKVEDVAKVGDEITVMVTSIDSDNRIRLSRQAVLEGWTPEEAMQRDRRNRRSGGSRSGSRGRGGRSSSSRNQNRSS